MRQPTVSQLDVGEEERGGIECEVVRRDVNERMREQSPPFSGRDGNGVVNETGRECAGEQREVQRHKDRAEQGEFNAPELMAERQIELGEFRTQRGRNDAEVGR